LRSYLYRLQLVSKGVKGVTNGKYSRKA
jgi:hypothetical protein